MEPWTGLARAQAPGGKAKCCASEAGVFKIRGKGWELMPNRAHHTEQALGRVRCGHLRGMGLAGAPQVLIGGLGHGLCRLRAAG